MPKCIYTLIELEALTHSERNLLSLAGNNGCPIFLFQLPLCLPRWMKNVDIPHSGVSLKAIAVRRRDTNVTIFSLSSAWPSVRDRFVCSRFDDVCSCCEIWFFGRLESFLGKKCGSFQSLSLLMICISTIFLLPDTIMRRWDKKISRGEWTYRRRALWPRLFFLGISAACPSPSSMESSDPLMKPTDKEGRNVDCEMEVLFLSAVFVFLASRRLFLVNGTSSFCSSHSSESDSSIVWRGLAGEEPLLDSPPIPSSPIVPDDQLALSAPSSDFRSSSSFVAIFLASFNGNNSTFRRLASGSSSIFRALILAATWADRIFELRSLFWILAAAVPGSAATSCDSSSRFAMATTASWWRNVESFRILDLKAESPIASQLTTLAILCFQ